jgi:uncharacterized membrane protein
MTWMDKIVAWNARQAKSWPIPALLLEGVVGFFLGGVLLAVIVPALHARGISLREWMAWGVIVLSIAACVVPDLYYRRLRRKGTR